jgi:hypothetical protein
VVLLGRSLLFLAQLFLMLFTLGRKICQQIISEVELLAMGGGKRVIE